MAKKQPDKKKKKKGLEYNIQAIPVCHVFANYL
jgi:hypothetical protein